MLNRISRFLKKVKSRKGYTLVEAATVVAITGAMAIVSVPIASDKIEDGKIATAGGSTQAIATAMVKFFGDTGFFPIAKDPADIDSPVDGIQADEASFVAGAIDTAKRVKVLRSGVGESGNNLDPAMDASADMVLWTSDASSTTKAKADSNLNNHLVADNVGYAQFGNLNWFGPYIPAVDQDPWGRNYLAYVRALDPQNLHPVASGSTIAVPRNGSAGERIYCWIISSGPDEKLQTDPTESIIEGDDIGTLVTIPPVLTGQNDKDKK